MMQESLKYFQDSLIGELLRFSSHQYVVNTYIVYDILLFPQNYNPSYRILGFSIKDNWRIPVVDLLSEQVFQLIENKVLVKDTGISLQTFEIIK
jgi:hypothetical protein